jgi:hypothetical protein
MYFGGDYMQAIFVLSFIGIFLSLVGLIFKKTRKHAWKILIVCVVLFGISGFFVPAEEEPAQAVNKQETQEVKKEESQSPSQEEEYIKYANHLVNRVGFAIDLINQGYDQWNSKYASGQVNQGIKELENEVKELDNLNPANSQAQLHEEFKKEIINIRDTAKDSLDLANQDKLDEAKDKMSSIDLDAIRNKLNQS